MIGINSSSLVNATFWSFTGQFMSTGISTIFLLVFARYVSPEEFGAFVISSVIVALCGRLALCGVDSSLIQWNKVGDQVLSTALWTVLFTSSFFVIVLLIFAPWLAASFAEPDLNWLLPTLAVCVPISVVTAVLTAKLRRSLKLGVIARRTIVANVLGGFSGLLALYQGATITVLVLQQLVVSFVTLAFTWHNVGFPKKSNFVIRISGELIKYGRSIMGADLITLINIEAPKLFIGFWLGVGAVGYFAMAQRFLNLILMALGQTSANVAFPLFSYVNRSASVELPAVYKDLIVISSAVFAFVFSFAAIFSAPITLVLLGEQWGDANENVKWLCLAGFPLALNYIFGAALMALGHAHTRFIYLLCNVFAGFF